MWKNYRAMLVRGNKNPGRKMPGSYGNLIPYLPIPLERKGRHRAEGESVYQLLNLKPTV